MDFELEFKKYVAAAGGVFENVKWSTMRGSVLTIGTMSNDHLANSLHYHKHLAEVAKVSPEMGIDYIACKFNEFLMGKAILVRQVSGSWDIDAQDFRLVGF